MTASFPQIHSNSFWGQPSSCSKNVSKKVKPALTAQVGDVWQLSVQELQVGHVSGTSGSAGEGHKHPFNVSNLSGFWSTTCLCSLFPALVVPQVRSLETIYRLLKQMKGMDHSVTGSCGVWTRLGFMWRDGTGWSRSLKNTFKKKKKWKICKTTRFPKNKKSSCVSHCDLWIPIYSTVRGTSRLPACACASVVFHF